MKFKMAATTWLSLTLDPMGKMFQNASSLKPLGQLKPNCPGIWRSSKKFFFFMLIRNPRWLPMQDIVLTQYHIGKYRKNLILKNYWAEWTHSVHEWSLNGLLLNLCFCDDLKSKMAITTCHSINTYRPIWEHTEIFSSLKLLHWLNLNCINHWKVLYKLCDFYVDRNSKVTTWLQDIVFT